MSKSGRAVLFALPSELTVLFDFYLQIVRPRLLAPMDHDYVFVNRNGSGPRSEIRSCVALSTQHAIGRTLTPHSFRKSIVTAFWGSGATESELYELSDIMAHTVQTAKASYYAPNRAKAALAASDRMKALLLHAA